MPMGYKSAKLWLLVQKKTVCFRRQKLIPKTCPWFIATSDIWYEYLNQLNTEMQTMSHNIVLVTDNCSHLPAHKPPKGYSGPPPPVLSNVKLVIFQKTLLLIYSLRVKKFLGLLRLLTDVTMLNIWSHISIPITLLLQNLIFLKQSILLQTHGLMYLRKSSITIGKRQCSDPLQ